MRNFATAVFLIFIFCAVSASGKDLAKGSSKSENSSLMSGTKKMFGQDKSFFGFNEPAKSGRTSNINRSGSSQRTSGKNRQLTYNSSFRNTLWEEKIKEWEKRHKAAAPKSLPRIDFKIHKHSSSRSYRSSHRSFRSSHSHRTKHSSRGKIRIIRRSRR